MKVLDLKSKGSGRTTFSLNGEWEIAPSQDNVPPQNFASRISVPSVVDCAVPGYDWTNAKFHWYRKRFILQSDQNEMVFLKIGQSQFGTDVWVNGTHAGRALGCYTSHEYEMTRLLRSAGNENEVIIRVGRKDDLPPESAVGKDQEKELYTPGIWGDVSLIVHGTPAISSVQAISSVADGAFRVRIALANDGPDVSVTAEVQVLEKKSRREAAAPSHLPLKMPANGSADVEVIVPLRDPALWSPDDPFLYEIQVLLRSSTVVTDEVSAVCGLREFRIDGRQFLLNGKRIFLKGGNIAFHRFLADKDRGLLPWNKEWIRRILIDIPKEHNFNFFRNHLGQLYPAWYDIADEGGMLIQNEWHFWGATGTKEQITVEFSQWLKDNWNHPSIVMWDPLNESTDDVVQKEIVPHMKTLDPTRPWESVDFVEQHPYIYSLGPVLNKERFGYTSGIEELEHSPKPVMVNEFLWWWVNSRGESTKLMDGVAERWLGPTMSRRELIDHQSYLASELVELFRRIRADAIQPFVYLSNDDGPTAHWFDGPIAELRPKPILKALKNAFSPVGVSIELWDRHFFPSERRVVRVFVLNDTPEAVGGVLEWGIVKGNGTWLSTRTRDIRVAPSGAQILACEVEFPETPDTYFLTARLRSSPELPSSSKVAHVLHAPRIPPASKEIRVAVAGDHFGNIEFLQSHGLEARELSGKSMSSWQVILIGEGAVREAEFAAHRSVIEAFLRSGGSVVILEPEFGLEDEAHVHAAGELNLRMKKREDRDKGGYDSYVFPSDETHPVWEGLRKDHLKMLNGSFGGEMVSQHDVEILMPHAVLASCGLSLRVAALAEVAVAGGRVLISRIQTRGRLSQTEEKESLYSRRADPVAQQYLLNLLSYASSTPKD